MAPPGGRETKTVREQVRETPARALAGDLEIKKKNHKHDDLLGLPL